VLAALDPAALLMPRSRAGAVIAVAAALASGELDLRPGADPRALRSALLELPGIGLWTAEYIALRAAADPDAFPASDLGLLRAARRLGLPADAAGLARYAERWRPFRAHAAQHLWHLGGGGMRHP
jgi:AraC family transcriptional regulator of adaptative response / DNA-3-methyladenine glycosylase II